MPIRTSISAKSKKVLLCHFRLKEKYQLMAWKNKPFIFCWHSIPNNYKYEYSHQKYFIGARYDKDMVFHITPSFFNKKGWKNALVVDANNDPKIAKIADLLIREICESNGYYL